MNLWTWAGGAAGRARYLSGLKFSTAESARGLERAAHELIEWYIRLARETDRSWHEIGEALACTGPPRRTRS